MHLNLQMVAQGIVLLHGAKADAIYRVRWKMWSMAAAKFRLIVSQDMGSRSLLGRDIHTLSSLQIFKNWGRLSYPLHSMAYHCP